MKGLHTILVIAGKLKVLNNALAVNSNRNLHLLVYSTFDNLIYWPNGIGVRSTASISFSFISMLLACHKAASINFL